METGVQSARFEALRGIRPPGGGGFGIELPWISHKKWLLVVHLSFLLMKYQLATDQASLKLRTGRPTHTDKNLKIISRRPTQTHADKTLAEPPAALENTKKTNTPFIFTARLRVQNI
jgi:hypothetical protein